MPRPVAPTVLNPWGVLTSFWEPCWALRILICPGVASSCVCSSHCLGLHALEGSFFHLHRYLTVVGAGNPPPLAERGKLSHTCNPTTCLSVCLSDFPLSSSVLTILSKVGTLCYPYFKTSRFIYLLVCFYLYLLGEGALLWFVCGDERMTYRTLFFPPCGSRD